ncbi:MAG: ferritin family protein [Syntrophaceae bacterium]
MAQISRRQFLYLSAVSPFIFQGSALAVQSAGNQSKITYPRTIEVLHESFRTEMIAYKNYLGYTTKAVREKYPNIAYLFYAFSYSEKVHADNYERILATLGHKVKPIRIKIDVRDTKSNLLRAAQNELTKIQTTYPAFISRLETETCEEAIINCMYSWKSHKQHEKKVKEISKYSRRFFSSVSRKIEGLNLDFHVCKVCGSTIDKAPTLPCEICNKSKSNYQKIERPR